MGYIIIDGLGSSSVSNPPNAQVLGSLWHYLQPWANAGSRNVVINGYGSALGPGQFVAWTPKTVAEWVNAGNIFIDWCEWPMYYQVNPNGSHQTISGAGFQQFAGDIGYDWLTNENFYAGFHLAAHSYPMTHGYQQKGTQAGIYLPSGSVVYSSEPANNPQPLNASGFSTMLGIHKPGMGWYFYAAFSPYFAPHRVSHEVYGAFIASVLHNQLNQSITTSAGNFSVQYIPYAAPSVTVAPTTSGPTSPYHISTVSTHATTSRTAPSSTAAIASTATTPATSTAPSSTSPFSLFGLSWQEWVAGGALALGTAVVVVVLVDQKYK